MSHVIAGRPVRTLAVVAAALSLTALAGCSESDDPGDSTNSPAARAIANDEGAAEAAWSACQLKFEGAYPGASLTEKWRVAQPFSFDPAQGKMRVAVQDADDTDLPPNVIGHVTCWVNPLTGKIDVQNVALPNGY